MGLKAFFDTYALAAILEQRPSYRGYGEYTMVFTIFNLVELYMVLVRDYGDSKAKELYFKFEDCLVDIDSEVVFEAIKIKLSNKKKNLSYADCVGWAYAKRNGLPFITGDKEFEGMENVLFIR